MKTVMQCKHCNFAGAVSEMNSHYCEKATGDPLAFEIREVSIVDAPPIPTLNHYENV
jgi:hypothetical protein